MKAFSVIAIFALLLSVLAVTVASAEETAENIELTDQPASEEEAELAESQINQEYPELGEDVGAMPDQPLRYRLKLFGEGLALGLTFNAQKRAEKQLEIANRRLLEMKNMIAKNKLKQAERLQERYEERIQRANEILQSLQENGNQAAILAVSRNIAKLQLRIENHEMAIEALKNAVAERNLTEEQKAKLESVLERMQNRTETMKNRAEQRQENIKERLRAVTNKSESEVEEILDKEVNAELEQAREKIAARWITRTENSLARINQRIQEQKMRGIDASEFESFAEEIKENLAEAKASYDAGNYKEAMSILKPVNNYGRQLSQVVRLRNTARVQALKEIRQKELNKLAKVKEEIRERVSEGVKERLGDSRILRGR